MDVAPVTPPTRHHIHVDPYNTGKKNLNASFKIIVVYANFEHKNCLSEKQLQYIKLLNEELP